MKLLICALALISLVNCQEVFDRQCKTPEELGVKTNFEAKKYLNKWYEIERYEQKFQKNADCVTAAYSLNDDGSVKVLNQAIYTGNGTKIDAEGRAKLAFPNESSLRGLFNVTFSPIQPNMINYWILDTDYTTYSVVYSCFNIPGAPQQSVEAYWLLSRTEQLTGASREHADKIKEKIVDASRVRTTIQDKTKCNRSAK